MLHDLLFALYGIGGQIFPEVQEQLSMGQDDQLSQGRDQQRPFKPSQDLDFLHPSERAIMDELTQSGFWLSQLRLALKAEPLMVGGEFHHCAEYWNNGEKAKEIVWSSTKTIVH